MKRTNFNNKVFTAFILAIAFSVCAISGIVLYLSPRGRVANWTDWTILGFTKEQWMAVHTLFVLALLIVAAFHLFYFNWKVFKAYLVEKTGKGIRHKRELAAAGVIIVIILTGTLGNVPPFSSVMALRNGIKNYWEKPSAMPPFARAEDLTLTQFADQVLQQNVAAVIAVLDASGVSTGPDELIKTIAARAGLAPSDIYERLTAAFHETGAPASGRSEGAGYGRMSFAQVCTALQIDVNQAIHTLQRQGIIVNDTDEKLRALARRYGRAPGDLVRLIQAQAENQNTP